MIFCPNCNRYFNLSEEKFRRHFLFCWKENHPFQQSKDAPQSKNIETRTINDDIKNFFEVLNGGNIT